jgi:transcriptional regulator with XRE-family HTH domain
MKMLNQGETDSFGYWVRRRRKALDLTQAALASQVGCATITIKKIERDERRPSLTMAERLADFLIIKPAGVILYQYRSGSPHIINVPLDRALPHHQIPL